MRILKEFIFPSMYRSHTDTQNEIMQNELEKLRNFIKEFKSYQFVV